MNYNRFTLLLGAGFTKNFGGPLGQEMWALIFNQPEVQKYKKLKNKMLRDCNYENLYWEIVQEKSNVTNEEVIAFQTAVHKAYGHLDSICHDLGSYSDFWGRCEYGLINLFRPSSDKEKGFIFTLNQDLFFERNCRNAGLVMPGIRRNAPQFSSVRNEVYSYPINEDTDYYELPDDKDLMECPLESELGSFNYIKLHGSYNFRKHHGWNERQMVIGSGKEVAINREPLLKAYYSLFKKVINSGQTKLLVLGYGFRDKHINTILSNAIHDGKVQVYVVDPSSPEEVRQNMISSSATPVWENLSGYFPYTLRGLLDIDGALLPGWMDLKTNYFESMS